METVVPSKQFLVYEVKSIILSATVEQGGTNTNLSHSFWLHSDDQVVAHDLKIRYRLSLLFEEFDTILQ